ncbi:MAG: hypothetical protein QXU06_01030 [Candidatus Bathyarchaeia archaeon]
MKRFYGDRLKRAAHLLLFKRGKLPGAKAWELKSRVGEDYREVLGQLNEILDAIDLEVKEIEDGGEGSRFLAVLKGTIKPVEARMMGWRIDKLAGLPITIAYIISKQGKAPRKEIEELLSEKLGRWKTMTLLDIYERSGYIAEKDGLLSLGWRAKAEVDLKRLMTSLLGGGQPPSDQF